MRYVVKLNWYLAVIAVASIVFVCGCEANKQPAESDKNIEELETKAVETVKDNIAVEKKKVEENTMVTLETTKGNIVIELDEQAAPVTSANFLRYVQEGFFDGTIFHRVIGNFMIQGGGFGSEMQQKQTHEPIVNEAANGLKNDRGTIAMARTNNPNSATAQFFINLVNNDFLNYSKQNTGYAVFGKVVEGMDTVDSIAKVKTAQKGMHGDVPIEPVIIKSAKISSGE